MKFLISMGIVVLLFQNSSDFQKQYYDALHSSSIDTLDREIEQLSKLNVTPLTNAYLGAIIMKRSSYEPLVKDKISMFKKGHVLLEKEINNDSTNVEFIFLRFAVQENAPKILNYNKNIMEDKKTIISGYNDVSESTQKQILRYSEVSKILSSSELP